MSDTVTGTPPDHPRTDGATAEIPPPPRLRVLFLALLVVAGLVGWGSYGHWRRGAAAAETQRKTAEFVPTLRTASAELANGPVELTFPGQTEAIESASLFARATGYVVERNVDIGSRVRKGDLLLRIAAPDLDQQLLQAEAQFGQFQAQLLQAQAQVDQAKANVSLANVTNARTATLADQGFQTKQNYDNSKASVLTQTATLASAEAGVKVAEANLKAQSATVDRLKALASFERVVAPFDGVVTARNVEVGNLVNADQGAGTPLFSMERDTVLRVTVQVPQYAALGIRPGVEAKINVPQLPRQMFKGRVERSSVALRYSSRTLATEVEVPNDDHALRSGLYVFVTLATPRESPRVRVPAEALLFNQAGLQVAVVADDATIRLRTVVLDRDYGKTVELISGLDGGERVVLGPPADLREGMPVRVNTEPAAKSASR